MAQNRKGIKCALLKPENLEALVEQLSELSVNVDNERADGRTGGSTASRPPNQTYRARRAFGATPAQASCSKVEASASSMRS